MDPDAALAELRDWACGLDGMRTGLDEMDAMDAFRALDEWLTNKGFPPRAWSAPEHPEA